MNINPLGQRSKNDPETLGRIKAWVRASFELPEETPVMLTELRCVEEGCPPIETVIALLDTPGQPRQYKVFKPMIEITTEDIDAAARGISDHQHTH